MVGDLMRPGSTQFEAPSAAAAIRALMELGFELADYAFRFETAARGYPRDSWEPFSWDFFDTRR